MSITSCLAAETEDLVQTERHFGLLRADDRIVERGKLSRDYRFRGRGSCAHLLGEPNGPHPTPEHELSTTFSAQLRESDARSVELNGLGVSRSGRRSAGRR